MSTGAESTILVVQGRVVDESGAGVEGATVRLLGDVSHGDLRLDRRLVLGERPPVSGDEIDQIVSASSSTKTDAHGSFRLEGWPRGPDTIVATAPGFSVVTERLELEPGRAAPHPILRLSRVGVALVVVTRDRQSGEPVAGMRVVAVPAQMAFSPRRFWWNEPSVGADAEGRFELVGLHPGSYRLFALSNGATHRSSTAEESLAVSITSATLGPVDLLVERGGVLELRISGKDGVVPEARCSLREAESPSGFERGGQDARSVDEDGVCRFEGLSYDSPHIAKVKAPGHLPQEVEIPELTRGEPQRQLQVTLEQGHVVRGVVRYGDGQPASGLQVTLKSAGHTSARHTSSNRRGRFELEEVPEGQAELVVGLRSFERPGRFASEGARKILVRVGPGTEDLDIEIDGVVLRGRVVDVRGRPVSGAKVTLKRPIVEPGLRWLVGTRASDEGRFVLRVPELPRGAWIEAVSDGYALSEPVPVLNVEDELQVELSVLARVVGRVLAPAESPVPLSGFVDVEGDPERSEGFHSVALDDGGEFELGVPPGEITLQARVEGFLPPDPFRPRLEPGQQAEVVFRVRVGATITGRVLDAAGTALVGARIVLSDRMSRARISDDEGWFRFENVPPGHHAISASHRDHARGPEVAIEVDPDQASEPLMLRFAAAGRVSGTVTRAGKPVVGVVVALAGPNSGQSGGQAWTDERGRFEIGAVADGEYEAFVVDMVQLMKQMPGCMVGLAEPPGPRRPVEVRAGQESIIAFELSELSGWDLHGTVNLPDALTPGSIDDFAAMGMVLLLPAGETLESGAAPVAFGTMRPSGDFRLSNVPKGEYTLAIQITELGWAADMPEPILHQQTVVMGASDQHLTIDLGRR